MTLWIVTDDEGDLEGEDGKNNLEEPYSLKSNDEFARKQRNLQVKQKFMREMRVVECIVDLLYMPFASGAFSFEKIN